MAPQHWRKIISQVVNWRTGLGVATLSGMGVIGVTMATPAYATELHLIAPKLPWIHRKLFNTYDHASMRRGYQVYKEVCAACHSMRYLCYRHLVNNVLTEDEAKEHAAEAMYEDGPNEDGEMFDRPGKLSDFLPKPYKNEEEARKANNGALPPDLSYVIKARAGEEDYVFHILTGYCDPPPGREISEGQYYHPYFSGGAISMQQALYNEQIEYWDGTPATVSQMAKDVTQFLSWASDPHHDTRKLYLIRAFFISTSLILIGYYYKRRTWSIIKSAKIAYKNRKPPKDI